MLITNRFHYKDRSPSDTRRRFWSKVQKTDECWLWMCVQRRGYGRFKIAGRYFSAHRVAYEELVGPIPEGMTIDHIVCGNRSCVNPAHMEIVTLAENTARSNRLRTGWKCNHEQTPENTYTRPSTGQKFCRTCRRDYKRRRQSRQGGG